MRATLAIFALALASPALAAKPAPAPTVVPAAPPGLVFAARTGLEDVQELTAAFRHARIAKETGVLSQVTVVVYGRAIVVFDPDVKLPSDLATAIADARTAGVRLVACETALDKYGIPKESLVGKAETVPSGIGEIARLVAAGDEVMSY